MTETTATPRRMKQPIKDELRRRLALAEALAAYSKGLFEDAIPPLHAFKAGIAVGAVIAAALFWTLQ